MRRQRKIKKPILPHRKERGHVSQVIIEGLQKIANRITLGLVLAALIVGAALLMRVETSFRIFGYPGFAILCFLGVGGAGLFLIIHILLHDRSSKK